MKKIITTILLLLTPMSVFALPNDSNETYKSFLQNHPFLPDSSGSGGCSVSSRKLENNLRITFSGCTNGDEEGGISNIYVLFESITITDSSIDDYSDIYDSIVNFMGVPKNNEKSIANLGMNFLSKDDNNLKKALNLIYSNRANKIIQDLSKAKLIGKYNINFDLVNNNGSFTKVRLKKPIEQRLYSGKSYDYLTTNYRFTVLKKNEYSKFIKDEWKKDKDLINKLNIQTKSSELEKSKNNEYKGFDIKTNPTPLKTSYPCNDFQNCK